MDSFSGGAMLTGGAVVRANWHWSDCSCDLK
jgi:hypothetical protein